jgi:Pentapeptide repeats (9 copies)
LAKCQFTIEYYEIEKKKMDKFYCEEEASRSSSFCIFHDKSYLEDKSIFEEHRQEVSKTLMDKVNDSITNNKALFCIGYYLPADIRIQGIFNKQVNFSHSKFQRIDFSSAKFSGGANFRAAKFSGITDFSAAKFSGGAIFHSANFSKEATFHSAKFSGVATFHSAKFSKEATFPSAEFSGVAIFYLTRFSGVTIFSASKFSGEADFRSEFKDMAYFHYVLFEDGKKVLFEAEDLTKVSFMNTDITRVRFSGRARWGQKDKFKVIEEEMLEEEALKESPQQISLGTVMAVYRNLRENYEYRLRYDEAGEFFIKEMELKRKYREVPTISSANLKLLLLLPLSSSLFLVVVVVLVCQSYAYVTRLSGYMVYNLVHFKCSIAFKICILNVPS